MSGDIPFIDLFWHWTTEHVGRMELIQSWSKVCAPTFTLEMHILGMQNRLKGETPRERYLYFVEHFLRDLAYLNQLYAEYPVLKEQIETIHTLWKRKYEEFFARLEADRQELESLFKPLGRLDKLDTSLSDPHNGGRSVLELTFESGCSLFYKPKNLGLDAVFNAFLEKLELSLPLRTYRVLNRESYGWVEKIEHLPCETKSQVENYYTRAGMLLCLTYLFSGIDFHHENIIAEGEHPVLIDLESLFHPTLRKESILNTNPKWRSSVLTTLMLPQFVLGKIGFKGLDISGLTGGQPGERFPLPSPEWENVNTDEMRLIYTHNKSSESKNLVYLGAQLQHASDYLEQIIGGFKEMYTKKEQLLKSLDQLCEHPVRFICRPTSLYFRLLDQMTDPAYMRSREGLQEIRAILVRHLIEERDQNLMPFVEEELKALMQRDIPFFQCLPKSLNATLLTSPYDEAYRRIFDMNEEDCQLQIEFIRNAFYSTGETRFEHKTHSDPIRLLSDEELLAKARQIGENLLARSFQSQSRGLSWIGLQHTQEDTVNFNILDETFYNGTIGIALYFAALYAQTKEAKWRLASEDALGCLFHVLKSEQIERLPAAIGLGGMSGIGGIVYVLSKMGHLNEALRVLEYVRPEHFEADKQLDVVGGSAGLLLVLLSLPGPPHPLITSAVEHLLRSKIESDNGSVFWKTIKDWPLGGFSHGAAGFSYALMKAGLKTGNSLYKEVALKSLAFERELYCPHHGNWPDLRLEKDYKNVSWCHGATGIGFSRLSLYSLTKDKQYLQEIENALEAVQKAQTRPHNACCGAAGRADFLKSAADVLTRPHLKQRARQAISQIVHEADREGGFSLFAHLPADAYNPGFMQGEAGIGYAILRCLNDQLPNVLLLD